MTTRAFIVLLIVTCVGCGGGSVSGGAPAGTDGDGGPPADEDVDPEDAGAVDAIVVYDGARRFEGADLYLIDAGDVGDACPALAAAVPPAALTVVTLADALGQTARFANLHPGERVVVAAVALDETGIVSALGCSVAVHVREGVVEVEVPLTDVPVSLEGVWEVESHLRVSDGLPLGTRLGLGVFEEMTDDANDPATFLLDLLLAQFIDDESLRTTLSWVRQSAGIDRGLNDRIRGYAPDLLADVLAASGDLVRALDDLRLDARLEVDAPAADGTSLAEHRLLDLVFEVEDRETRFSIADDVGLRDTVVPGVVVALDDTGRVDVGSHSFQVGLGTVALFALHEVVLRRLDGAPRTMGELLTMLVDCREVGDWLSEETGMGSADDWQDACTRGLEGIGGWLERQILAEDERLSTLTLEGHAQVDGKVVPHALEGGSWEVTWSGAAEALPFGGSFAAGRVPSRVVE